MTTSQPVNWQPVVDWLQSVADRGGAFVEREAPALAEEIIRWGIVEGIMGAFASMLIVIAVVVAYVVGWRKTEVACRRGDDDAIAFRIIGGTAVGVATCIVMALGVGPNASSALKAYAAPRLYLVEQITEMLR